MNKYNANSIKPFKSKMVILKYTTHKVTHELSGVITASTKKHVLFCVNNDKAADEINLLYENIINITIPEKPSGKLG